MVNAQVPFNQTKNPNEWHTPSNIIELVKKTFGGQIDLDPASSAVADQTVQANKYYDQKIDGLTQNWNATSIFLNPPFSKPAGIGAEFINKIIDERNNYDEAIVLIYSNTDTNYYQKLASSNICRAICFKNKRIKFNNPTMPDADSPAKGSSIFYIGDNLSRFYYNFGPLGFIANLR